MVKIRLNEGQLNKLFEYHSQQWLPFKDEYGGIDYEYGVKNIQTEFMDWLEEFGKYGELGRSSISFSDGIRIGFDKAFSWFSEKSETHPMEYMIRNKFVNGLSRFGFCYYQNDGNHGTKCRFNDNGNMYVERMVVLSNNLSDSTGFLFDDLVSAYNDNVGGCWCWKVGGAEAYCGNNHGSKILMRGWIRLDDIDWIETVYINSYRMNSECEIRVKPNAKVELFDIVGSFEYTNDGTMAAVDDDSIDTDFIIGDDIGNVYNTYRFNLGGRHLIVNSTYFNNNGKYDKNGFAKVYDANSSEQMYRDREGNIMDIKGVNIKREEMLMRKINSLQNGNINKSYSELFDSVMEIPRTSLCLIRDSGKAFLLDDSKNDELVCNMFFTNISFEGKYIKVYKDNKFQVITLDGKFLLNDWYDEISLRGSIFVNKNKKWGLYNGDDTKFIFDEIGSPNYGSSVSYNTVLNCEYTEVKINGLSNIIDIDGEYVSPVWFEENDYKVIEEDGRNIIYGFDVELEKYIYVDMLTRKKIGEEDY